MWKKGYHQPIGKYDYRKSSDYLFDSETFEVQENPDSVISQSKSSSSSSTSLSKGFFKAISSLTHGDVSPKKQSSREKERHNASPSKQSHGRLSSSQAGMHPKSFLDMSLSRETSSVRSSSPTGRRSTSSHRSNASISRTTSNTVPSRLNVVTNNTNSDNNYNNTSSSDIYDNPFLDSDDDLGSGANLKHGCRSAETLANLSNNGVGRDLENVLGHLTLEDSKHVIVGEGVHEVDENYPFLKKDYQEMVKDPYCILSLQNPPRDDLIKYNKLVKELTRTNFDITSLKAQAWGGIPSSIRALVWQILVGYLSTNKNTRITNLSRKRKEYVNSITRLFRSEKDQQIWHQIKIDVLRTNPTIKLYSFEETHRSLEKILYLWAIRHPASGYVQGINDLITPFFQVFLSHYLAPNIKVEEFDPQLLPKELLNVIEADTYWCLTKALDTIQDNYIHQQPGIIRQIEELKNLIKRDEPKLATHFETENLDFIQFAFRWMNCMLMREFKLNLIIRMWDTYLSNFPTGFSQFHIYVCCSFLRRFSDDLLNMEFQDIIMFLQDSSKTEEWNEADVELMLSEAFVWQSLYENASAHLK